MNGLYHIEVRGTAILFYKDEISEVAHFHDKGKRKQIFERFNKKIAALKQPHLNQILIIYDKDTMQEAVNRTVNEDSRRQKNNNATFQDGKYQLRIRQTAHSAKRNSLPVY